MKKSIYKKIRSVVELPTLCALAGVASGIVVTLFRFCVNYLSSLSSDIYEIFRQRPQFIPLGLVGLAICAFFVYFLVKIAPDIKGGGIPRAEGIMRGLITFKWLRVLIGTFVSGLISFFSGLSLGTEGPSVMLGTATGKGVAQRSPIYARYVMTGAGAAGFSVATGAPIAGVVFVLEEIHKRFSFMLLVVVMWTVACAYATAQLLGSLLNIDSSFLHIETLAVIPMRYIYIPIITGIFAGITATVFNRAMSAVNRFFEIKLKKLNRYIKLIVVMVISAAAIMFLPQAIGSGQQLITEISNYKIPIMILLVVFAVKIVLITTAANSGVTGGLFVPVLVLGAIAGGIVFKILHSAGIPIEFSAVVVIMCMCAMLGASMHAPITAMVFCIEITGINNNSLFFIISVLVSFTVMQIFKTNSLNDIMLSKILRQQDGDKQSIIIERKYEVMQGSFLIGKTVRDVLFPPNAIIKTYVRKGESNSPKMVKGGDKVFRCGDTVVMQLQTYDVPAVERELNQLFAADTSCQDTI